MDVCLITLQNTWVSYPDNSASQAAARKDLRTQTRLRSAAGPTAGAAFTASTAVPGVLLNDWEPDQMELQNAGPDLRAVNITNQVHIYITSNLQSTVGTARQWWRHLTMGDAA